MNKLKLKISFFAIILWGFAQLGCYTVEPDFKSIYDDYFSEQELTHFDDALRESIDTMLKYHLDDVAILRHDEWKILEPKCFNSSLTRSLILVGKRGIGREYSNTASIIMFLGFRYKDHWHFMRYESIPLLMEEPEGKIIDQYTFDRINEIAIDKILKHSVMFDPTTSKWIINDDFFLNFFDNNSWIGRKNRLNKVDYRSLPDTFFLERYMNIIKIRQRRIQVLRDIWNSENELRNVGEISNSEWKKLLRLRYPKSSSDWRLIDKRNREIEKDSIIVKLHLERRNS